MRSPVHHASASVFPEIPALVEDAIGRHPFGTVHAMSCVHVHDALHVLVAGDPHGQGSLFISPGLHSPVHDIAPESFAPPPSLGGLSGPLSLVIGFPLAPHAQIPKNETKLHRVMGRWTDDAQTH
jgi:hypothetical protein